MNEVKSCPFCGRAKFGLESFDSDLFVEEEVSYNVWCHCGARGPNAHSPEEAVEKWNLRP
jgi:Lar family restriction alleviation protein